ncbi:hypothetical protein ASPTUDRAFT_49218 [Aspergillus tubingensis CBS 134.48]|uniref:ATP-dependent RNA helicase n=1 Tax=Aspergillus tubingensis (strain CBS 134.48) TaxID=767770 RepID=A0A1L9NJT0_ASPTC|nr:hypothetical protein ASPTUDRAFT_49218 [Aspergillus tubingensis CBS 134.48]
MLGAFRRSAGAVHALRASRSLLARSIPQQPQWLSASAPAVSYGARALYHPSPAFLDARAAAQAQLNVAADIEPRLPSTDFHSLAQDGLVNDRLIRTVTNSMKIQTMTDVQAKTIRETLSGDDVLAQAKTGTGKTLAFLIPVIQRLLNDPSIKRSRPGYRGRNPPDIRAIVISPTRELAEQIANEAQRLVSGLGLAVQTAVGGTQKRLHLNKIRTEGCNILVGTPGRLKDLLSDPYSGVKAPQLQALVFDEADRLLDDGFSQEIGEIKDLLPAPEEVDRQTLMFSATVPGEVMDMVRQTMKPDFKFIKTVMEDEVPTHLRVPQKVVYLDGFQNGLPAILELAKKGYAENSHFKAIVYLNATTMVSLANDVFRRLQNDPEDRTKGHALGRLPIYQIHSRLTQAQRTRVTSTFRSAFRGILFSSDVTARGLDFPDVTHVIQYGLPNERQTYIHRVGRTGRANKEGEGWILLHKNEKRAFKQILGDLPIEEDQTSVPVAHINMREEIEDDGSETSRTLQQYKFAAQEVPIDDRVEAWRSQAGTIIGKLQPLSATLPAMHDLCTYGYLLPKPPQLPLRIQQALERGDKPPPRSKRGGPRDFRSRDSYKPRSSGGYNDRYNDRYQHSSSRDSRNPWNERGSSRGRREGRRESRSYNRY